MKIIFLINSGFPYYSGGIETWLFNISKRLCEDYDITIVAQNYRPYELQFDNIPNNIKFIKYKTFNDNPVLKYLNRSYMKLIDYFIGAIRMGHALKKITQKHDEYYIIALDTMFNLNAGWIVRKNKPFIKLIASSRGPHAEVLSNEFPLCKNFLLSYERKMLKKADAIWANGYDTTEMLKNKGFESILMRNGIDFNQITQNAMSEINNEFNTNNIKIGCFGTLLDIKGINELIDALSVLSKNCITNVEVFFIGKGSFENYKRRGIKLNVENRVHFLGFQKYVGDYMRKCDIIACLSGGSGMSMAAIEAMGSGVPIIAWNNSVYRQFNKEELNMLLVKEKDVDELADGIKEIINNYQKYITIASRASMYAKSYDWSYIKEEFLNNLGR